MQIGVESSRAVENKRVFVVDCDEINRAVLQFMLHDENETHEFATLDQVYAKAEQWVPDLLLVGLEVVRSHGEEVLAAIRARIPAARIIVVTESASDPLARSCLKMGAQALLAKPLTIESVRRKVDIALGRRASVGIPVHLG